VRAAWIEESTAPRGAPRGGHRAPGRGGWLPWATCGGAAHNVRIRATPRGR
jgi:hypothetical protein